MMIILWMTATIATFPGLPLALSFAWNALMPGSKRMAGRGIESVANGLPGARDHPLDAHLVAVSVERCDANQLGDLSLVHAVELGAILPAGSRLRADRRPSATSEPPPC